MRAEPTSDFMNALRRSYARLHASQSRVLLAVSGGADSLALMLATVELRRTLALEVLVASVDHGLRPESAEEVQRVGELAAEAGLPFHPIPLKLEPRAGMEERARRERYRALEQVRRTTNATWIVTAHTADDQAETLLMRLARGTSLTGAAAILEKSNHLLRPMLSLSRAQVLAYLQTRAISPVEDPHNQDPGFFRVRVRQHVLPALVAASGSETAVSHLAAFASLAAEDEACLSERAESALERLRHGEGVDAVGLRALEPALQRRVLVRVLHAAGARVDLATVRACQKALSEGGEAGLSHGLLFRTQGGTVRVCRSSSTPRDLAASLETRGEPSGDAPSLQVSADEGPWKLRRPRPGDRVRLVDGRHKKLKELLIDHKVSRELRADLWVVTDAREEVIWVPGVWPKASRFQGRGGRPCYLVLLPDKQHGERPAASL